ncbi:MAG: sigma-70 family RNA polymerase sigma factor [Myxococcales bacterium]|nr:sigma-70 family RNA polymerase sigma factor [Myxococcales bacterium]
MSATSTEPEDESSKHGGAAGDRSNIGWLKPVVQQLWPQTHPQDEDVEDDEALLQKFVLGDVSAFARLAERYEGRLLGFCSRMLKNKDAARDATQEIFVKIIRGSSGWRGTKVRSWMFTIARNHCFDELKKVSPSSLDEPFANEDGQASTWVENVPAPEASAERQLASVHLRDLIIRAIDTLPDQQREVFLLKEEGQLSFREMGDILDVPTDTVKSRMRYALQSLRKRLKSYGVTSEDTKGWGDSR